MAILHQPGLDHMTFDVIVGFSSYTCQERCRFGAICSTSSPLGQSQSCTGTDVLTLLCWLTRSGVTVRSAKDNSLHACVPPAGTRTRVRTIDPSQTPHSQEGGLSLSPTPRQGGGGSPGLPLVCVNILEHTADANPQFRRGYMEDSPRASRLS